MFFYASVYSAECIFGKVAFISCLKTFLSFVIFNWECNCVKIALIWVDAIISVKSSRTGDYSKKMGQLSPLRILAIHDAKNIPPWYILLDYFTTRPSFKNLNNQAKHVRGVWFLVILTPCIASIVNCCLNQHFKSQTMTLKEESSSIFWSILQGIIQFKKWC